MSYNKIDNRSQPRPRQTIRKKQPKSILAWLFSWVASFFFLPFFMMLGVYAMFYLPQPEIPPTFEVMVPPEKANRLEEEMEIRREKAKIQREELAQSAARLQETQARHDAAREKMMERTPGKIIHPDAMHRYRGESLEYIEMLQKHKLQQLTVQATNPKRSLVHDVQRIRMNNQAKIDWQKSLAEITVKRASITAAFVAACLLPALILLVAGRGLRFWPMWRGLVLAAPLVSVLALLPWVPLEHPYFAHPRVEQITDVVIPLMADIHTFFITGYVP